MIRHTSSLTGVPETALWTLFDRASEARRPQGVLHDPDAVRICDEIAYDYLGHFGPPSGSHAARAAQTDIVLRQWLKQHPDGMVISLGEGLETQALRVDNGAMRWLSVDLPDMLAFRERFLPPDARRRHHPASALDLGWLAEIDPAQPLFVVAQGLFMYLEPDGVRALLVEMAERFRDAQIVFDTVPRWFAALTQQGLPLTPFYVVPPMPWGIDPEEIEPTLRDWHPRLKVVSYLPYGFPRGWARAVQDIVTRLPALNVKAASLIHARIG
ncbi:MAG: class I SAM-dependent methyltransferase [Burkholderiales bacterium]